MQYVKLPEGHISYWWWIYDGYMMQSKAHNFLDSVQLTHNLLNERGYGGYNYSSWASELSCNVKRTDKSYRMDNAKFNTYPLQL